MGNPETNQTLEGAWTLEQLRSLNTILCFPSQPIHETYIKAYGPRVKKEAAVYAAAILESVCAEILRAAVGVAQSNTFKSKRRNKKTRLFLATFSLLFAETQTYGFYVQPALI